MSRRRFVIVGTGSRAGMYVDAITGAYRETAELVGLCDLYLYRRAFENFQMGYASAMAWVLLLAVALCTAILFKTSGRWVFYEAKEGR